MLQSVPLATRKLDDYRPIVGDKRIDEIQRCAAPLRGARVLHLSATGFGGGVAELLSALVPLMRSAGLEAEWKLMAGDPELWTVTKALHNLLQGADVASESSSDNAPRPADGLNRFEAAHRRIEAPWTPQMVEIWKRYNDQTARLLDADYDFLVIHDPQPAGVLTALQRDHRAKSGRCRIWRCHIDLTQAATVAWDFLRPYLEPYDAAIFTMQQYVKPDLPVREIALIAPAIDPLSPKNLPLPRDQVRQILQRFDVDPDRPLISQISRFDPWKDPLGVIDVYRRVKRAAPGLQLALVASMATDDPEGWRYYELAARHAGEDMNVHLLTNFLGVGNVEVNALQSASKVVLQKSIREGFALSVSEALWKGRPVVATAVGGIPLQVASGLDGYLVSSTRECAQRTLELLEDPDLADRLGQAGRERVRENFLSTRELSDYLQLFNRLSGRSAGDHDEERAAG